MNIKKRFQQFLNSGHERTIRAKKNILLAIIFKGMGILIGFAYFPISLTYLSPTNFGIFLTLASIIDWFGDFNIGIGNGLRNKLGESVAEEDYEKARGYVSTAYVALGGIFSGITLLFVAVSFFLPWTEWLQVDSISNFDIAFLAVMMLAALAVRFISSLIYEIFFALQRVAMVDFYTFLTKLSFLLVLLILIYFTEESLLIFGAAKTFTFALVPAIVGLFYYRGLYKQFRPSIKLANRVYLGSLFSLGIQFFAIKIAMMIIHKTNNFLIAGYVHVNEVPLYEASFKYLSIFLMLFLILTNQLWAANIEAYKKQDFDWMKRNLKGVIRIWVGTVALTVVMVAIAPFVYHYWLQDKIQIPMVLTIAVAASITATNWVNLFNLVLNGTGKIRLQMYLWIAASIMNIPVSIFFATVLGMGTMGIVWGTTICLIPLAIICPIQVYKILNQTDTGIWRK